MLFYKTGFDKIKIFNFVMVKQFHYAEEHAPIFINQVLI